MESEKVQIDILREELRDFKTKSEQLKSAIEAVQAEIGEEIINITHDEALTIVLEEQKILTKSGKTVAAERFPGLMQLKPELRQSFLKNAQLSAFNYGCVLQGETPVAEWLKLYHLIKDMPVAKKTKLLDLQKAKFISDLAGVTAGIGLKGATACNQSTIENFEFFVEPMIEAIAALPAGLSDSDAKAAITQFYKEKHIDAVLRIRLPNVYNDASRSYADKIALARLALMGRIGSGQEADLFVKAFDRVKKDALPLYLTLITELSIHNLDEANTHTIPLWIEFSPDFFANAKNGGVSCLAAALKRYAYDIGQLRATLNQAGMMNVEQLPKDRHSKFISYASKEHGQIRSNLATPEQRAALENNWQNYCRPSGSSEGAELNLDDESDVFQKKATNVSIASSLTAAITKGALKSAEVQTDVTYNNQHKSRVHDRVVHDRVVSVIPMNR